MAKAQPEGLLLLLLLLMIKASQEPMQKQTTAALHKLACLHSMADVQTALSVLTYQ